MPENWIWLALLSQGEFHRTLFEGAPLKEAPFKGAPFIGDSFKRDPFEGLFSKDSF